MTKTSAFNLPANLAAKSVPPLISADDEHFRAIADSLATTLAQQSQRLDAQLRSPGGTGQAALERDLDIHRITARLNALSRYGIDLCLGRMVPADGSPPVYIGRIGLVDDNGERLLLDWRSPAAEPFFGATHANPLGLSSRRRYRWGGSRVTDYWDEVFTLDGTESRAALDDQSAFIASLGGSRSPRMRDVLATIQTDQDAIIRAPSHGALVVDGGPGTGKTVVALHRAAYLLYADPRLSRQRSGLLFVGPHNAYLAYVADVLPSLGEDGVKTCILRDLVADAPHAGDEPNEAARALKSAARLVAAIEAAVRHYEQPPTKAMLVETPWADVWLSADDWAEAFGAAETGAPHNQSRAVVWEELLEIVQRGFDDEIPRQQLRRELLNNGELQASFNRAWPLLDPAGVVADLWSVPAYLRKCAPWLEPEQVAILQRPEPRAFTVPDLPYLDAARHRIGDPAESRRAGLAQAELAAQREQMDRVVETLIQAEDYDDGEGLMTILRGEDARNSLADDSAIPMSTPNTLAGPFAHIVVDEAQELSDAEWTMLLSRCPSRSFTIVGDRAQARRGFAETWQQRLGRVGIDQVEVASLSVNYRTPTEIMAEAEPVIRAVLPDANVPESIRTSGVPVIHGLVSQRDAIIRAWTDEHAEGIACVIGDAAFVGWGRVRSLSPALSKGLEFDLVVLVNPQRFESAVDRYVAMTRATQQLVVLTSS